MNAETRRSATPPPIICIAVETRWFPGRGMWRDAVVLGSLISILLLLAPPTTAAPAEPAPVADAYTAEQAVADVEMVLTDRGKGYLDARARLYVEKHSATVAQ